MDYIGGVVVYPPMKNPINTPNSIIKKRPIKMDLPLIFYSNFLFECDALRP